MQWVRGDGRTYRFRLSTDARHRGGRISYSAEFPTKAGDWTEVFVPFSDLKPGHHGNDLDGPPLNLAKIEEIGIQLADKKPGPFSVNLDWIKVK